MQDEELGVADDTKRPLVIGIVQLVFVVAVIASAVGLSSALNNRGQQSAPKIADLRTSANVSIRLVELDTLTYRPAVRVNGTVQSSAEIAVSTQVSGEIKRVSPAFRAGMDIKKGELLFEIDRADYILAVERAQADVAAAESDLKQLEAEAELARQEWEELFPGREVNELAAREPQIAAAKARLGSAQANKRTSELSLERTRVYAPSDARVISSSLDVGQIVSPNQSVGRMISLESIELVVPVSIEQLNLVSPVVDRSAMFQIRGRVNDMARQAQIVRVDASLDPRTRLTNLYLTPVGREDLRIGDFVDVVIEAEPVVGAIALPASALSGQNAVWLVSDGKLRAQSVIVLGERSDGAEIVVAPFDYLDGVVALPPLEAFDGLDVTIRDEAKKETIAARSGGNSDGAQ